MTGGKVRVEFTIKCNSYAHLITTLHRKNVSILFVEQKNGVIKLVVDYKAYNKVFAICKNMCYNILKIKYKGLLSPFFIAYKNIGITIGFILFCILSSLFGDIILQVEYTGSGSAYKSQTNFLLASYGVNKYDTFSNLDFNSLENYILENNSNLSFVTCKKSGNRLVIDSQVTREQNTQIDRNNKGIISDAFGVIEKINILRGTLLVSVGDTVNVGDVLVAPYITGKDNKVYNSFAIGYITIISTFEKEFVTNDLSPSSLSKSIKIAEFICGEEVVKRDIEFTKNGFIVRLSHRHLVKGG